MHGNGPVLDDEILADPEVAEAIKTEGSVHRAYDIFNTDRAFLGRVGGAIARLHGDSGFAGTVSIDLKVCIWTSLPHLSSSANRGSKTRRGSLNPNTTNCKP